MNAPQRRYVLDLADWELPRVEALEWALAEHLVTAARATRLRREALADAFHVLITSRVRALAETAVNEAIEYWLKGLGDGNDGRWPELTVELPYLEHGDVCEPLTLSYRVANPTTRQPSSTARRSAPCSHACSRTTTQPPYSPAAPGLRRRSCARLRRSWTPFSAGPAHPTAEGSPSKEPPNEYRRILPRPMDHP